MRFAVLVFPGTWSDRDCHYAITEGLGQEADYVWHRDTDLSQVEAELARRFGISGLDEKASRTQTKPASE